MTIEAQNESENDLETIVKKLEKMVANPEEYGIFDDLGKKNLEAKLQNARDDYGRDLLANI